MRHLTIAVLIIPLVLGAGTDRAREPGPLRGVPLRGGTGLRLLVAGSPPALLDVDTGRVTPVRVLDKRRQVLMVVGVGGRAAVVLGGVGPAGRLYGLRGLPPRLSHVGHASDVVPAADGRSVWAKSFSSRSRCVLRQLGLDGRQLRRPRSFPCASTIVSGGSAGLVVNRTRVIDPLTGRTVLKTRWGVLAAVGKTLVLAGPDKQFTLLDAATGTRRPLRWPSIVSMTDQPAVDPRGLFVALAFGDPAWSGGPNQALDIWLLDIRSGKLTQLPAMPAVVGLKHTNMAWTHDGRLVLLAESDGKEIVAVWRPGQRRLALKTVRLERTGGSDTFAPVR